MSIIDEMPNLLNYIGCDAGKADPIIIIADKSKIGTGKFTILKTDQVEFHGNINTIIYSGPFTIRIILIDKKSITLIVNGREYQGNYIIQDNIVYLTGFPLTISFMLKDNKNYITLNGFPTVILQSEKSSKL